ncbi:hypothetical protein B484DRAFT_403891 [Ochromonadaceae sp. CCMP2298]|nr:hypothetical protein B484DRAFT_403891 [Ochromonadaceae sp. CCMP2298]
MQVLDVKEWRDESWRAEGGFQGRDFCHSASASVRVLDYVMLPATSTPTPTTATATPTTPTPTATTTDVGFGTALEAALYPQLVGPAHFTARAESHQGLCHGGSFCALMDDAIGWMGFCVSGTVRPWSGYTVQINTSLKKSVAVGSVLRLESWVRRREGARKFWIDSRLVDAVSGTVHCEAQGLFLLSKEQPFD